MITVENLSKTFYTPKLITPAVQDVSLEIHEREIFGIMGTSGAGKSTLVRCLNFLEIPDEGSISIEGFGTISARNGRLFFDDGNGPAVLKEKKLRKLRSQIGMIFQHFNLLDRQTVAENIAYPIRHSKMSRSEIENRVDELLALVHLEDKKYSYPSELSGGQKQRVAIARALASHPRILLCDEATSALDPQATASILSLLRDLKERLGLTVVIITHEMDVIKKAADRAAVMKDGQIVETGSVYDLFLHPVHPLTRQFVYNIADDKSGNHYFEELGEFPEDEESRLLRLNFDHHSLSEPILFEMIRDLGIQVNILMADIDRIGKQPYGTLLVRASGTGEQIDELKAFLDDRKVAVEEETDA